MLTIVFSIKVSSCSVPALDVGCDNVARTSELYRRNNTVVSAQFSSVTQSCPTLCDPMNRSMPGLPVHHQSWSSLRLTSIESVIPSSHLILCRPFSSCLQPFPALGTFPVSQFFTSGSQRVGASASASVFSMNIHD